MNFEEVYKEYLNYASKQHKKQSFDSHLYNFNANILPFFKDYLLVDIDNNLINDWQSYILDKNFSNNYNKNLLFMLKGFLNYCCKKYYFDKNIVENINSFPLKIEFKKTDFYTLKEFKKFIKCFDNEIYKQFFNLMFFTGTRPGEAMALKFSDLNSNSIIINKTIDSHGNREIGTPKTISSNRIIEIDKKLFKDLLKLKEYYISLYGMNDDYFIFGGVKPLSPTTINRYKLDACNKAKLRPITLHQFRHSHATLLLNNKIDIHVISKRLGHSKVSTTLDVYTHNSLLQEKRTIKVLNSIRFNIF